MNSFSCERQIPKDAQEDKESIEKNHTYCILFDGGQLNEYLSDTQRHNFVKAAWPKHEDDPRCT